MAEKQKVESQGYTAADYAREEIEGFRPIP